MAKTRYRIGAMAKKTMQALNEIENSVGKGIKKATRIVASDARNIAVETLKQADIRQKHGKNLHNYIGLAYKDGTAVIYAPTTQNSKIRQEMYWAEHGTGYHPVVWRYETSRADKIPSQYKHKSKKDGKLYAFVHESRPAGYMAAARRYLMANTRRKVAEEVKLLLTRRPRGYNDPDKIYQSNLQGSFLEGYGEDE